MMLMPVIRVRSIAGAGAIAIAMWPNNITLTQSDKSQMRQYAGVTFEGAGTFNQS